MTEKEQVADIVRIAMKNQNVEHRPNRRLMREAEKNLIFQYGGMYAVCKAMGIPSKAAWLKKTRTEEEEVPSFIQEIIYDAMDEQEVSHQPLGKDIPESRKRLIELHGGLKEVCKKMGILTKKKKAEATKRGKEKILQRDCRLELARMREIHKNDIY